MINVSNDHQLKNLLQNITALAHRDKAWQLSAMGRELGDLIIRDFYEMTTVNHARILKTSIIHMDFQVTFYRTTKGVDIWLDCGDVNQVKETLMFTFLSENV